MFNWILTSFGQVESKLRDRITTYLRAHTPDPKPSMRRLLSQWQNKSLPSMVQASYHAAERLADSPEARKSVEDNTTDRKFWLDKSAVIVRFRDDLEDNPKTDSHLTLLMGIKELLAKTHVNLGDAKDFDDFKSEFRELIQEYYEDAIQWSNDEGINNIIDFNMKANRRQKWYPERQYSTDYLTPSGQTDVSHQHTEAIAALFDAMTHNQIPDDIIVFMLTPSLSQAGYAWYTEDDDDNHTISYLLYMPYTWIVKNRDSIWEIRMKNKFSDEDFFYDPSVVDDEHLVEAEQDEMNGLDDIKRSEFDPKSQDAAGKGRPAMDEHQGEASSGPTKSKKKQKKEKEKIPERSQTPPPPPPKTPPPQPTLPDDTDYIPNQSMSLKVKDLTDWLRAKTDLPDEKDHLKRFGATSYDPVPMRRIDLLSTDTRIFQGANILSQMYMVTYTRMARKPIFNPVN